MCPLVHHCDRKIGTVIKMKKDLFQPMALEVHHGSAQSGPMVRKHIMEAGADGKGHSLCEEQGGEEAGRD